MRSVLRRTMVAVLLMVFLAPGLLQARTSGRAWAWAETDGSASEVGFLRAAWNLLAALWESKGVDASSVVKTGGTADPAGSPGGSGGGGTTTNSSGGGSEGGETGGTADPSGG